MGGMTGSLLLLLWAGVSVSTMVDLQKRIIHGDDCKDTERLYHVKLIGDNTTHTSLCGGSLISDQWILTAAHCLKPGWTLEAVLRVHPGADKIPETIKEENIHQHVSGDIMLLKLTTARPGFDHINLPNCSTEPTPKKGAKVQIAGHAATNAYPNGTRNPDEVDHLQCADIVVEDCPWAKNLKLNPKPNQHRFCGGTNPKDACKGDSGGGVVYNDRIYGVISTIGKKACTSPIKFMDVCAYMTWIVDTMKL